MIPEILRTNAERQRREVWAALHGYIEDKQPLLDYNSVATRLCEFDSDKTHFYSIVSAEIKNKDVDPRRYEVQPFASEEAHRVGKGETRHFFHDTRFGFLFADKETNDKVIGGFEVFDSSERIWSYTTMRKWRVNNRLRKGDAMIMQLQGPTYSLHMEQQFPGMRWDFALAQYMVYFLRSYGFTKVLFQPSALSAWPDVVVSELGKLRYDVLPQRMGFSAIFGESQPYVFPGLLPSELSTT